MGKKKKVDPREEAIKDILEGLTMELEAALNDAYDAGYDDAARVIEDGE